MKRILLAFPLLLMSCNEKAVSTDFDERLLDLVIETRNGRTIELPDLYGKVFEIPEEKKENLILSGKLRARGFQLLETENVVRGFTGVRVITQRLTKEGCDCEVTKTYNRTAYVDEYAVSEKIKCE
jgi:hypothetical protein